MVCNIEMGCKVVENFQSSFFNLFLEGSALALYLKANDEDKLDSDKIYEAGNDDMDWRVGRCL